MTLDLEYFRYAFAYTRWARDRVLGAAEKLTEADYVAPRALDHGSIHSTLFHTFAAEGLWRRRWMGEANASLMPEGVAPDLTGLWKLWLLEDAKVDAYLRGLAELDLGRPVGYTSAAGVRYSEPLYLHLTQVVIHGAQHRSEVALELTHLGYSPGFLDFIAFVRENPRA
jgi:uncharacterized damage-inducible protein DinB